MAPKVFRLGLRDVHMHNTAHGRMALKAIKSNVMLECFDF